MTVTALVTPSVAIAITSGTNPTCSGGSITFTATPTNGGTPTYQWTNNGTNISGETSVTYTGTADTDFVNGDLIRAGNDVHGHLCIAHHCNIITDHHDGYRVGDTERGHRYYLGHQPDLPWSERHLYSNTHERWYTHLPVDQQRH